MNRKHIQIQSLLRQRAERIVPRSEINLWPAIQTRLAARAGASLKPSIAIPVALALALAAVLLAVSPQGRALARQLQWLFFQTAPDIRPNDPAPLPTPTAAAITEDVTQWRVFKPTWLPDGFEWNETVPRPGQEMIVQSFTYQHATGMEAGYFYLGQKKAPFTDTWPVGESAHIETVQIGDLAGEYVIGAWGGAGDHQEWENTPAIQHLRWQAEGYYFDLQFNIMGVAEADFAASPCYLTKDQLIAIAASLK